MKADIQSGNKKMGRLKFSILNAFIFTILFSLIMLPWNALEKKISIQHTASQMILAFVIMSIVQYFILWPLNEKYQKNKKQNLL
jgi:hypothetical protein